MKPKADWRAVDSPKKQRNKFVSFAFLLFMANKTNLFIRFLRGSMAGPNCFQFYLNFSADSWQIFLQSAFLLEKKLIHPTSQQNF